MTYSVLIGTLNPTDSLTHSLTLVEVYDLFNGHFPCETGLASCPVASPPFILSVPVQVIDWKDASPK